MCHNITKNGLATKLTESKIGFHYLIFHPSRIRPGQRRELYIVHFCKQKRSIGEKREGEAIYKLQVARGISGLKGFPFEDAPASPALSTRDCVRVLVSRMVTEGIFAQKKTDYLTGNSKCKLKNMFLVNLAQFILR